MKREHQIVITGWTLLSLGGVAACFIAGAALIGWAVGRSG